MESLLEVVSVEVRHSEKSNCDFKIVNMKGVKFLGNRNVKTNVQGTRNLWPTHEVTLGDGTKTTIKGDVEYDNVMVGDLFDGEVKVFATTVYQIDNGPKVNQYKTVVFSHENPMIVAAKNLIRNNAAPLDEEGNAFKLIGAGIRQPETVGSTVEP